MYTCVSCLSTSQGGEAAAFSDEILKLSPHSVCCYLAPAISSPYTTLFAFRSFLPSRYYVSMIRLFVCLSFCLSVRLRLATSAAAAAAHGFLIYDRDITTFQITPVFTSWSPWLPTDWLFNTQELGHVRRKWMVWLRWNSPANCIRK